MDHGRFWLISLRPGHCWKWLYMGLIECRAFPPHCYNEHSLTFVAQQWSVHDATWLWAQIAVSMLNLFVVGMSPLALWSGSRTLVEINGVINWWHEYQSALVYSDSIVSSCKLSSYCLLWLWVQMTEPVGLALSFEQLAFRSFRISAVPAWDCWFEFDQRPFNLMNSSTFNWTMWIHRHNHDILVSSAIETQFAREIHIQKINHRNPFNSYRSWFTGEHKVTSREGKRHSTLCLWSIVKPKCSADSFDECLLCHDLACSKRDSEDESHDW